jgi:hypothetical protein
VELLAAVERHLEAEHSGLIPKAAGALDLTPSTGRDRPVRINLAQAKEDEQ